MCAATSVCDPLRGADWRSERGRRRGSLGCWEGVSSGSGPSAGGGTLVDLDVAVFQRVCGLLGTEVGSIVLIWR